jgi:hypothetical protein
MDIDYLIDRLEALIRNGKRVPLTGNKIMIDEQECYDLIDQMRITVPEEVKIAKRTLLERERILADANEDAQHLIEQAERERQHMLGEKGLLAEAERQREIIISVATEESDEMHMQAQSMYDEAVVQAQEMREGANQYAVQVLQELETLLGKHFSMVQNGLRSFKDQAEQYQQQIDEYQEQYKPEYVPAEKVAQKNSNAAAESGRQPAQPTTTITKKPQPVPANQPQQQRPPQQPPNQAKPPIQPNPKPPERGGNFFTPNRQPVLRAVPKPPPKEQEQENEDGD